MGLTGQSSLPKPFWTHHREGPDGTEWFFFSFLFCEAKGDCPLAVCGTSAGARLFLACFRVLSTPICSELYSSSTFLSCFFSSLTWRDALASYCSQIRKKQGRRALGKRRVNLSVIPFAGRQFSLYKKTLRRKSFFPSDMTGYAGHHHSSFTRISRSRDK